MKITSVEIWEIGNSLMPHDHPIIIRVNTDEGISGLGEVGLAYGTGHSGGAGYVNNPGFSMAHAFKASMDFGGLIL